MSNLDLAISAHEMFDIKDLTNVLYSHYTQCYPQMSYLLFSALFV